MGNRLFKQIREVFTRKNISENVQSACIEIIFYNSKSKGSARNIEVRGVEQIMEHFLLNCHMFLNLRKTIQFDKKFDNAFDCLSALSSLYVGIQQEFNYVDSKLSTQNRITDLPILSGLSFRATSPELYKLFSLIQFLTFTVALNGKIKNNIAISPFISILRVLRWSSKVSTNMFLTKLKDFVEKNKNIEIKQLCNEILEGITGMDENNVSSALVFILENIIGKRELQLKRTSQGFSGGVRRTKTKESEI